MAEVDHNLLEVIQIAIKLSKLEQHPVGSLWATMSDDDPAVVFGGGGVEEARRMPRASVRG